MCPPEKPAWQRAMEEHERTWQEIVEHFARFIAEHHPDGLPVRDEATLTDEERREWEATKRACYVDCLRAAEALGYR